jgi:1,2-phenylacetyl-CoA epoxidase PaaB subunit
LIFLVVFSRRNGLKSIQAFQESEIQKADSERQKQIREHLADLNDLEIALFQSESIDVLSKTHSRYFKTLAEMQNDALSLGGLK